MWFSNYQTFVLSTQNHRIVYRSFVYKRKIESGMQCFVTTWCNNVIYQQSLITRVCCEAVRSAILATAWLLVSFARAHAEALCFCSSCSRYFSVYPLASLKPYFFTICRTHLSLIYCNFSLNCIHLLIGYTLLLGFITSDQYAWPAIIFPFS